MGANLKEVRERIKSVISTQQITKAMKVVSAAKLRKAQMAIVQMRPYSDKLNQMLTNILSTLDGDSSSAFGVQREVQNAALVVITSNRGLCGAFNTNVIKSANTVLKTQLANALAGQKLTIIPIGKKGFDHYRKRSLPGVVIEDKYVNLFENLQFDNVSILSKKLMDAFSSKQYDAVYVCYGRFKNAGTQFPEAEQWLPVGKLDTPKGAKKADYIFEPDQQSLLEHLVPSILQTSFFKFLLDTHASEHGARMTAMDKASENANEMLKELKINYNKARQEAITKELSEIVGGAAALEG
jgi:F-type H+-transporting ATPase subunit gamma